MTILHRLAYAWPSHFWAIWLCGLALVLLVSGWIFDKAARDDARLRRGKPPVTGSTRPSGLLAVCFALFLVGYIGFMLWGEDFAYKDGHSFTEFSAIGRPRPP